MVNDMLNNRDSNGVLENAHSLILEYATLSGAGKSRWGFEVERLLQRAFPQSSVLRVGLNFYGGTGGGAADRTFTIWAKEHDLDLGTTMAALLLARGILTWSPEKLWQADLQTLSTKTVIDTIFKTSDDDGQRFLIVHVDELAMLLKEGFDDRALKDFVDCLADYNCGGTPLGLVIPVITHTTPVAWDPRPTLPLERLNLRPFSFEESKMFFQGSANLQIFI